MKIMILRDKQDGPDKGSVFEARKINQFFSMGLGWFQIIEKGPYLGHIFEWAEAIDCEELPEQPASSQADYDALQLKHTSAMTLLREVCDVVGVERDAGKAWLMIMDWVRDNAPGQTEQPDSEE